MCNIIHSFSASYCEWFQPEHRRIMMVQSNNEFFVLIFRFLVSYHSIRSSLRYTVYQSIFLLGLNWTSTISSLSLESYFCWYTVAGLWLCSQPPGCQHFSYLASLHRHSFLCTSCQQDSSSISTTFSQVGSTSYFNKQV